MNKLNTMRVKYPNKIKLRDESPTGDYINIQIQKTWKIEIQYLLYVNSQLKQGYKPKYKLSTILQFRLSLVSFGYFVLNNCHFLTRY